MEIPASLRKGVLYLMSRPPSIPTLVLGIEEHVPTFHLHNHYSVSWVDDHKVCLTLTQNITIAWPPQVPLRPQPRVAMKYDAAFGKLLAKGFSHSSLGIELDC
jgi:hypothetical protein